MSPSPQPIKSSIVCWLYQFIRETLLINGNSTDIKTSRNWPPDKKVRPKSEVRAVHRYLDTMVPLGQNTHYSGCSSHNLRLVMSSGPQEEGGCEMKPATIQEQTATCRKIEHRFARPQRCQLWGVTDIASWSYLFLRDEAQTGDYRGTARVSKPYHPTHIAISHQHRHRVARIHSDKITKEMKKR